MSALVYIPKQFTRVVELIYTPISRKSFGGFMSSSTFRIVCRFHFSVMLLGIQWYQPVVLICMSLMTNEVVYHLLIIWINFLF